MSFELGKNFEEKNTKPVYLTGHRKISKESKCSCGAKMIMLTGNYWICTTKLKEELKNTEYELIKK